MLIVFSFSLGSYACKADGLDCTSASACCSGICDIASGQTKGKCGCRESGDMCTEDSTCCSLYCNIQGLCEDDDLDSAQRSDRNVKRVDEKAKQIPHGEQRSPATIIFQKRH